MGGAGGGVGVRRGVAGTRPGWRRWCEEEEDEGAGWGRKATLDAESATWMWRDTALVGEGGGAATAGVQANGVDGQGAAPEAAMVEMR